MGLALCPLNLAPNHADGSGHGLECGLCDIEQGSGGGERF